MAEDMGDMKAKEMRFEDVLRRHLDRTMASPDSTAFIHNVSKLQSLLAGLLDKETEELIKDELNKESDGFRAHSTNIRLGQNPPFTPSDIKERTTASVLKILIKYCNEKGWLLEKVSRDEVWELEDEDADETAEDNS